MEIMEFLNEYPPVYLEDEKLCGMMKLPNYEGYTPVLITRETLNENNEPIHPLYLSMMLKHPPKYHDIHIEKLVCKNHNYLIFYLISHFVEAKKISRVIEEHKFYIGMIRFFNSHFAPNVLEHVDNKEKFNMIFNDASHESIINTLLMYQVLCNDRYYAIPYRFHGLVEGLVYYKPFMEEHQFLTKPPYQQDEFLIFTEENLKKGFNHRDSNIEFYLNYGPKTAETFKNHSKRYYTEYGF